MIEEVVYTADDEEPNCNRCDNIECEYLCIHNCGSEHGWNGYERSELMDVESQSKVCFPGLQKGVICRIG